MEEDGTPPIAGRFLVEEAESPVYHRQDRVRAWPPAVHDSRGLKNSPFFPAANVQNGAADTENVLRLLEDNWYWQQDRRLDPWPTAKALEKQRSLKYSALRSSISQGNNAPATQRPSNGLKDPANGSKSGRLSLRQSQNGDGLLADVESDTTESEASEPPSRRGTDALPERNPEDVDSLGTWAQRVLFFPSKHDQEPEREAGQLAPGSLPNGNGLSKRSQSGLRRQESKEEEEAAHAAWRWRFNRRWRHEQQKQLDPDFGMDGDDEDGWDAALGYLDACGPGVHLQIGRMSGDKPSDSLVSSSSGGWGLLTDESHREKSLGQEEENATNNIASKARKVQELYKTQQKIEKDVKARWGDTKVSMTWAGCHVKVVDIDMFGQFPFILAKISDNTKAHRLVVRGKRGRTHKDLLKTLTAEAEEVSNKHRLPMVKVGLLGTGVMEWSREKADRINVSQGAMTNGCDAIQSKDDVVRVAGALTRSSLPTPTRVTVNGEKLS